MPKYLIKILPDDESMKDIYFRRFENEDINAIRRALDEAIERKPRAKRADAGKPRAKDAA